jgi:hypothetical protein
MPYTGTTPYTAQEFVPGQKALAQDMTNMSYVLARLDTNSANAFCVREKPLSTDNQSITSAQGGVAVTVKQVDTDPLGMATGDSDITIPFDGIWTVAGFFSTSQAGGLSACGCWFRKNHVSGNGLLLAATTAPSGSISTSTTLPLAAGDVITPYFSNKDSSQTATLWNAVCSVVLVH